MSYYNPYYSSNYNVRPGSIPLIGGQYAPLPDVSYSDPFASNWYKSDFTSPRYIMEEITNASQFKPIGPGSPVFGKQPYGKNPDAEDIQEDTQDYLNTPIPVPMPVPTYSSRPVPSPYAYGQHHHAMGGGCGPIGYPPRPQPQSTLVPFGVALPGFPVGVNSYAAAIGSIVNGFQYGVYPQRVPDVPSNGFGIYANPPFMVNNYYG